MGRNQLPDGKSSLPTLANPEVATILIGGHRSLTAAANFNPSMEPGMWTSVKMTVMSKRLSRMRIASSAFSASTTSKPSGSNHIDCVHADQELILHDQNDRPFFSGLNHAIRLRTELSTPINVGSISTWIDDVSYRYIGTSEVPLMANDFAADTDAIQLIGSSHS